MCYAYKYPPDTVLDMQFQQFMFLANNLDKYREEESIAQALAVWGESSTGSAEKSVSIDTPEDLHRLFGGGG